MILDEQLSQTIKSFLQVGSTVVHADRSGNLRRALTAGKKIIVTTVQKFPYILDDIGSEHQGRSFAIVIDEAHSSQGSKTSAAVSRALGGNVDADDEDSVEDQINRIIEAKKLLPNASYFAFTATPKNRTLEMFGEVVANPDGTVGHSVPRLHDEAGRLRGLHRGRAREFHAGGQLFQADEDRRG